MKETLRAGIARTFRYRIAPSKTVPRIYPEAPDFQLMPEVFATGYMVALCEWAAIELIKPHLDWPREMTLGTHVDLSHVAATPPGFAVEVTATLTAVEGRKLVFAIHARDDDETIAEGRHERHVIDAKRFGDKVAAKAARAA
jgi:fluoroacetyl-CoA thioesterase